jgi:hypothetical protein
MTRPDIKISIIDIVLPEEYSIIERVNDTDCEFSFRRCCHEMIIDYSKMYPDKTAVIFDDISFTFNELIERCTNIAGVLQTKYRIIEGDVVIQCLERSVEMVFGMIAIIMIGGVYCPIHPEEPIERIKTLIEKTGSRIVTTMKEYQTMLQECSIELCILDDIELTNEYDIKLNSNIKSVAYMMTTSGSTGVPKIMSIQHLALYNYTMALTVEPYNWDDKQRCLQVCRCSFDQHLQDIYSILMLGSTVVESSLKKLGVLTELQVAGDAAITRTLSTSKIEIGKFSVNENNLTVTDEFNVIRGSTSELKLGADITIGTSDNNNRTVSVYGKLAVGVANPKEDVSLTVAGSISFDNKKFTTGDSKPTLGSYNKGDIVWNTDPKATDYIGWVCVTAGSPGAWLPFGSIARQ